jgi:hypothetical protein
MIASGANGRTTGTPDRAPVVPVWVRQQDTAAVSGVLHQLAAAVAKEAT